MVSSLDTMSLSGRSKRMSLVKSRNTKPELRVRQALTAMGLRYRLHSKGIPGKPDIVFHGRKKLIFVHGCFWHRHSGCSRNRMPKSPERQAFWESKLGGNEARDRETFAKLKAQGWSVLVVWECETESSEELTRILHSFLLG